MTISIFLADDHAVVRDGLRLLLETQPDFKVVGEAESGVQAISRLSKQCADVLIIDIAMPELNGIEAARQISLNCPDTRVIILSMHSNPEYISRALQAGAHGYVLKSSVGAEVIKAIRAVLAGHRYLSQKVSDLVVDDYLARLETSTTYSPLDDLSPRELSILQLVAEGYTSVAIGDMLGISPNTVDTYRSRILHKLNLDSLPDMIKFAIKHGIIPLE
jgi:DNA-binding NarL/FixJ family response regulator